MERRTVTLPAEKNYPVHEQEQLAIICALKEWRHYVHGTSFQVNVKTDHRSLQYLYTQRNLSARQTRWMEYLAQYPEMKIEYQEGAKNVVADALSRRSDHMDATADELQLIAGDAVSTSSVSAVATASSIMVPKLLDAIRIAYQLDAGCKDILDNKDKRHRTYRVDDGLIYKGSQLYIPADVGIKTQLLFEAHDAATASHVGAAKTIESLTRHCYWPGMHAEIRSYVQSCMSCQSNKAVRVC